jgi:D-sedoheptulose 7-phosphate isomerase
MFKDFIYDYLEDLKETLDIVPLDKLEKAIEVIRRGKEGGLTLFVMGNGGSAATASHFAADLNRMICVKGTKRTRCLCLNDNIPALLAHANDISFTNIFVEQLKNLLEPDDIVLVFSTSGKSENVIEAVRYANENSAVSIAFTGFDGGLLSQIAQISIVVPNNNVKRVEDIHLILAHIVTLALQMNGEERRG